MCCNKILGLWLALWISFSLALEVSVCLLLNNIHVLLDADGKCFCTDRTDRVGLDIYTF